MNIFYIFLKLFTIKHILSLQPISFPVAISVVVSLHLFLSIFLFTSLIDPVFDSVSCLCYCLCLSSLCHSFFSFSASVLSLYLCFSLSLFMSLSLFLCLWVPIGLFFCPCLSLPVYSDNHKTLKLKGELIAILKCI